MKSLFRYIITKTIAHKAHKYLKDNNTKVIAITGSIGKTSTKEAVYAILKDRFNVYRSTKGFNTEIGLSLSILQESESGFSSISSWFNILKRIFFEKKDIYQTMILEMGADQPGDIKKLIKIAKPSVSIITNISPVHLEKGQFKDIEDISKEKSTLIKNLSHKNLAILNYDNPSISKMETHAKKITYGTGDDVMLKAKSVKASNKDIKFIVNYKPTNEEVEFTIPVLGKFQIYVLLPAIAVGLSFGMSLEECAESLKKLTPPQGRMTPIEGINKSMIIDSSYNASPETVRKALDLLNELKGERKIAALGTMNELGETSREAHLEIGKKAVNIANIIIAVGPEASIIKEGAVSAGMKESDIYTFFNSEEAGDFLKEKLEKGDLILVKGSQNKVRMERLIKIIMKNPEHASKLLCRQGEVWDKIN